jgi:hypothetical protein
LVLKVVIGALIVTVAGLTVKLAMTKPTVQTNVAETTTIPPTTVTLAQTTTSTTKLSDSTCLDINKYAIPKQADTADIKIIQKALGVTPIGGNCGPKTQSALGDFRNQYAMSYGASCILNQEVVVVFNDKYCSHLTDRSQWINETPLAEKALRTFYNLATSKNYSEAQKYFWDSNSNPSWSDWVSRTNQGGEKDVMKFICQDAIGESNIKEIVKTEQLAPNTYKFTYRVISKDGTVGVFGLCCGMTPEPGVDYSLTMIIVRKINNQFLVSDGIDFRP